MKRAPSTSHDARRKFAQLQGAFFVVSGVWPIVHIRSFEQVTGPKVDRWLVKTVGALISVIGGALLDGASRKEGPSTDLITAAAGSAAALAVVDVVYVARRRISPIYLLDAVVELGIVACWAALLRGERP